MSSKRPIKSSSLSTGATTTVSIALVLFLLAITVFVVFMGREVSKFIKENLSVTVELSDNADKASIHKLEKTLRESPFVKSLTFIGKDEIKQELIEELGSDPEEILGYIPAFDYFDINLKSEYANPDSIKMIEKKIKGYKLTKSFLYSEDTIELINSNLSKIATGSLALAIILMFISFTLIRNTVRLNIYSQRFLINTMQLVGATNSFIRKPFMIRSLIFGILAALFANIGITALIYSLTKEFPELISIVSLHTLLFLYGIIFLLGIVITVLATASAVNRYLKMNTNNLYHI